MSVVASNSSTHENMKQKNAVAPIPLAISGVEISDGGTRKRCASYRGRFVDLTGYAADEESFDSQYHNRILNRR